MPCYHLMDAWRVRQGGITFNPLKGVGLVVRLPCGQCVGCRLERSRQWAMRCVHEASLFEENCFITLTYSDEFLPVGGSLVKKHFQDFMKRLRFRFADRRIRFFHCGEYGERYHRPHYHCLLFNFDFTDKVLYRVVDGIRLYTSEVLSELWTFRREIKPIGFSSVGAVTFESAAYVARYVLKKVTGEAADWHYIGCDVDTGELTSILPEYATMSRRPGIGREWYEQFSSEVFPRDEVVMRGRLMKPPRFYDLLHELDDPDSYARIKAGRRVCDLSENTFERLRVREICKESQVRLLKRSVDDET